MSATKISSKGNAIYFTSNIDEDTIIDLMNEFIKVLEGLKGKVKLTLYLDSRGGNVGETFKFIDFVAILKQTHQVHLTTVCWNRVASAATLIALIGDVRYITANTSVMIHELSHSLNGTYTDMKASWKQTEILHEQMILLYLSRASNLTRKQIADLLERDTWFSAQEYIEMGFAEALDTTKIAPLVVNKPENKKIKFSGTVIYLLAGATGVVVGFVLSCLPREAR